MEKVNYPKVALAVILTPDDIDSFKNCLKSVGEYVDGIFVNLNHPKTVPQSAVEALETLLGPYEHKIITNKWEDNFVKARRQSFDLVPKDYEFILWLDADDEVDKPEKIREVASIVPKSVSAVYVCYDYAHDEYGNVTVPHYVARLVRNDGVYQWKSSFDDEEFAVHETLSETRTAGKRINEEFKVVHNDSAERSVKSLYRNIDLLQKMYDKAQSKGTIDPRILFYLGTHLYDSGDLDRAKQYLQSYMLLSGWANERSEAMVYIGLIYKYYQQFKEAKGAFMLAISESPNNPRPYTEIAEIELNNKRYADAADWAIKAIECKKQQTVMATRPADHTFRPYLLYAEALCELGGTRLEEANKYVDKALKLRPADPDAKALQANLEHLIEIRDLNRAFAKLAFQVRGDTDKSVALLEALPDKLKTSPVVAQFRFETILPKKWPKKSIVIFCGASVLDEWSPSILNTKGTGGSEEAVIRLSKELEKRGWEVHVYGTPTKQDLGDRWHYYWDFNPKDEFDVLIAWRSPWFYENQYKARKKYLWMHDVMPQAEFTQDRLDNLDKVMLLSEYHRSLFPNIPDNKVFLTGNGITVEDFDVKPLKRDLHRIIWMSSHVRGLQLLYDMWPDVKKAVPKAKLDIYYGWESYVNVNKDNPERMLWKQEMEKQVKQLEDVTDHGKISQARIVQEIFKSGIWAYPCPFPEISCITAMKAQAGGAIPVSSNFAALDETVRFGIKVPMKQMDEKTPVGKWDKTEIKVFKDALIDMLSHPEKQETIREVMMPEARKMFDWKGIADQWVSEFQS